MSRWHADIRPRLNSVERRGNFDIHRYGSDIIGSFPGPGPGPGPGSASHRQDGGGGGMSKSAKSTVSFEECVRGKEREEICRYFLSALMLANTSNIELSSGVSEDAQVVDVPSDHSEPHENAKKKTHMFCSRTRV